MRRELAAAVERNDKWAVAKLLFEAMGTCLAQFSLSDQALVVDLIDSLAEAPPQRPRRRSAKQDGAR